MSETWVHESPIEDMKEGASFAIGITINGGTTISASSSKIYKNNNDMSSTILSGSDSYSGNVATSKTMTFAAGTAGTYVYCNTITCDGITWVYACEIVVTRASAVQ
jgi:hypothetical protein